MIRVCVLSALLALSACAAQNPLPEGFNSEFPY
jgi:hypothetical protein